jgi:hypothetical protein
MPEKVLFSPRTHAINYPTPEIFDNPAVGLCLNQEWIPHIAGALETLRIKDYWPSPHQGDAVEQIDKLLDTLAAAPFETCQIAEEPDWIWLADAGVLIDWARWWTGAKFFLANFVAEGAAPLYELSAHGENRLTAGLHVGGHVNSLVAYTADVGVATMSSTDCFNIAGPSWSGAIYPGYPGYLNLVSETQGIKAVHIESTVDFYAVVYYYPGILCTPA